MTAVFFSVFVTDCHPGELLTPLAPYFPATISAFLIFHIHSEEADDGLLAHEV
jgi:hypothetical protein